MLTLNTGAIYNIPPARYAFRACTKVNWAILDPVFMGYTADVNRCTNEDRADWGCWS